MNPTFVGLSEPVHECATSQHSRSGGKDADLLFCHWMKTRKCVALSLELSQASSTTPDVVSLHHALALCSFSEECAQQPID